MDAEALARALRWEFPRRGLTVPHSVAVPEGADWSSGYATASRGAPVLEERDLESALATARRFIDPVLRGEAVGEWDPDPMVWRAER